MMKKLLNDFNKPGSEFRGKPFWAWNGTLEPAELQRQIRVMKTMGLGGFFMHSRVGLGTPYLSEEWFDCVDACVDEAKRQDMEAWMYDEDRWPSGAGGGLVTKDERYRQRFLVIGQMTDTSGFRWQESTVAAFIGEVTGEWAARNVRRVPNGKAPKLKRGETLITFDVVLSGCSDWYNGYTYLDTLNHDAVAEFIKTTHEAYRKNNKKDFGKTIPGIFTDEPNFGNVGRGAKSPHGVNGNAIPWTGRLPEVFQERYGYDLIEQLPAVMFDLDGTAVNPVRWQYMDCITHLFVTAFAKQIGDWCEKNGIAHTGHVLAEATLRSQTGVVGSCMRFYEYMQAPGMDILTEYNREYDTAKMVSSAARQFGCKWRLTETYGCTGWQFPFSGHKAIGDWQLALGINLRCQHLSWYTMEGQAKRDYPAGIFYQSPWWELYGKVEDYFARAHAVMTRGKEVRDLLVIHPVESAWLCVNKDCTALNNMAVDVRDSLLAANIDFDYVDEDILARHAKPSKKTLKVGQASYKTVLVPPQLTIRQSTLDVLKAFADAGGKVVFAGKAPRCVDAVPSDAAAELAKHCEKAPAKGAKLAAAVEDCRRVSITDSDGHEISEALYLLREDKDASYLFIANTGEKMSRRSRGANVHDPVRKRTAAYADVRVRLLDAKVKPVEFNADTGEILQPTTKKSGDSWTIHTSLPQLGSRIFAFPKKAAPKAVKQKDFNTVSSRSLSGDWNVVLSESNNLVLDQPRFRIDGGKWQEQTEILRVDFAVRDALGIKTRGGQMKQPWIRKKAKNPKRCTVDLQYNFDVRDIPSGDLALAIERPETFCISLNGHKINMDAESGWWVDRSLRKIPVDPSMLKLGRNELTLVCDYSEDHPGLEIVYLLGNFGVKVMGRESTLVTAPTTLKLGNWVKQGLPFYSGSVSYSRTLRPELDKKQRLFVSVPAYDGVAVRVIANGRSAGVIAWEPNEVDVTDFVEDGKLELRIEVIGHRRNSHGPLHLTDRHPRWTGPGQFVSSGDQWTDDYILCPCGLSQPPVLDIRA